MDDNSSGSFQEELYDDGDGGLKKSFGTLVGSQFSYDAASIYRYSNSSQHRNRNNSTQYSDTCAFSTFGEMECGEPMEAQHIILDFTPTEQDEDESVRRKCLDFWEYFESNPVLKNMVVEPETMILTEKDEESRVISSSSSSQEPEKTALDLLEEFAEKDMLAGLLSCKLPVSGCSLHAREYQEHDPVSRGMQSTKMRLPCRCIGVCNKSCKKLRRMTPPNAQHINKTLNQWTLDHPKSMEPPGHPPELRHAIMQRKKPSIALQNEPKTRRFE